MGYGTSMRPRSASYLSGRGPHSVRKINPGLPHSFTATNPSHLLCCYQALRPGRDVLAAPECNGGNGSWRASGEPLVLQLAQCPAPDAAWACQSTDYSVAIRRSRLPVRGQSHPHVRATLHEQWNTFREVVALLLPASCRQRLLGACTCSTT
jgi:hypothetical protein